MDSQYHMIKDVLVVHTISQVHGDSNNAAILWLKTHVTDMKKHVILV